MYWTTCTVSACEPGKVFAFGVGNKPDQPLNVWRYDIVANWVLVCYAVISVVAIIGWIRYWFGPVDRQRLAVDANAHPAIGADVDHDLVPAPGFERRRHSPARYHHAG